MPAEGTSKINSFFGTLIFALMFFGLTAVAQAADFNSFPSSGTLSVGQEITVDFKINSPEIPISQARAVITFSSDFLEVKRISRNDSVFDIWLQEPAFSNPSGTISFIGKASRSVSGSSLHVFAATFAVKRAGAAKISFADGAINAAGTNNNVLNTLKGSSFVISLEAGLSFEEDVYPVIVPTPVPIKRIPARVTDLPDIPDVSVLPYPDQESWYNVIAPFIASWTLPSDISGVNTAFNKNPDHTVAGISEGLFESKLFAEIRGDGEYYLHAGFKNNMGWSQTAHYRIAIDTQPPLAFDVAVENETPSDDPTPKLLFGTEDSLSGIDAYLIQIDDQEFRVIQLAAGTSTEPDTVEVISEGITFLNVRKGPSTSENIIRKVFPGERFEFSQKQDGWYQIKGENFEGWVFGKYVTEIDKAIPTASIYEYELPPLKPGKHTIAIRAIDKAGNGIQDTVELEILPIDPPVITFYTGKITQETGVLNARGTALPNARIIVTLEDYNKILVLQTELESDKNGIWGFTLKRPLSVGQYKLSVQTRDDRGAVSFHTDPVIITVARKPVFTVGNITFFPRDLIVIFVIAVILAMEFLRRKSAKKALKSKKSFLAALRNLKKSVTLLKKSANKLQKELRKKKINKAKADTAMDKLMKDLDKMEKHSKNINLATCQRKK